MTDVAENTDTVVTKTRKPRSPNKPRTPEKQAYFASKKIDKLNAQCEEAVRKAAHKVRLKFKAKVDEFLLSLPADVLPNVTGVIDYVGKVVADEQAENPDVTDNDDSVTV